MNRLWKWLLHSDAKAPLLVALPCFIAVCGWLGWQEFDRFRAARADAQAEAEEASSQKTTPSFDPVEGLGILPYVTNQLSPDTLVIPVNPFLPTFEALVLAGLGGKEDARPLTREEWRDRQRQRDERRREEERRHGPGGWGRPGGGGQGGQGGGGGGDDDWGDPRAPKANPAQPTPRLTYCGFMQRPDGRFAPLFHDSSDKSNHFAAPGGVIHGVKILSADKNGASVQSSDGAMRDLKLGDGVDLPGPDN